MKEKSVYINNKNCNVHIFCVIDARWDDFVVGMFFTYLCISNQNFRCISLKWVQTTWQSLITS